MTCIILTGLQMMQEWTRQVQAARMLLITINILAVGRVVETQKLFVNQAAGVFGGCSMDYLPVLSATAPVLLETSRSSRLERVAPFRCCDQMPSTCHFRSRCHFALLTPSAGFLVLLPLADETRKNDGMHWIPRCHPSIDQ